MDSVFKHYSIINTEIFCKEQFLYQLCRNCGSSNASKEQGKTLDSERYFSGNLIQFSYVFFRGSKDTGISLIVLRNLMVNKTETIFYFFKLLILQRSLL